MKNSKSKNLQAIIPWMADETVSSADEEQVSAMALLDEFTAAQITDFIRVASENHADNVKASLLAYKNSRFPEIDPMAEFTLDF